MINLKNDKGVTLIILTITIIVLLIITGITINNSKSQLMIKKVNNLYSDIEQIQTEIDSYYLENKNLPILNISASFNNSINPNDSSEYLVIDLSKLGNLRLNYGRDFENIKKNNLLGDYKDVYIINKQSQTIYYLKGIEFEGKIYYTKPIEYELVEE